MKVRSLPGCVNVGAIAMPNNVELSKAFPSKSGT